MSQMPGPGGNGNTSELMREVATIQNLITPRDMNEGHLDLALLIVQDSVVPVYT